MTFNDLLFSRQGRLSVAVFLTMLALALDSGGTIGIRALFPFGLLLIFLVERRIVMPPNALLLFALMVAYPTCLFLIGLLRDADLTVALSQYRSTIFTWVTYLLLSGVAYQLIAQAMYTGLVITSALSIFLAGALVLDLPGVYTFSSLGYFGMRSIGGILVPNVQFMSTLFYVPAALYFLMKGRLLPFCICFLGLIMGISKAGIIFLSVAGFLIILTRKGYVRWMGLVLIIGLVGYIYSSPLFDAIQEIYEGDSETVDVRLMHYESVKQLFSEDLTGFLFGFGLGSSFYSTGADDFVTGIELDHLNTIRKYGLVWSLIFFSLVLWTAGRALMSKVRDVRTLGICLLSAFVLAGTNPVLISPIFWLILFVTMQGVRQSEFCLPAESQSKVSARQNVPNPLPT